MNLDIQPISNKFYLNLIHLSFIDIFDNVFLSQKKFLKLKFNLVLKLLIDNFFKFL
jgi:hypothetical protein